MGGINSTEPTTDRANVAALLCRVLANSGIQSSVPAVAQERGSMTEMLGNGRNEHGG